MPLTFYRLLSPTIAVSLKAPPDVSAGIDLSDSLDELLGLAVFLIAGFPEALTGLVMAVTCGGRFKAGLNFAEREGGPWRGEVSKGVRKGFLSRNEFLGGVGGT